MFSFISKQIKNAGYSRFEATAMNHAGEIEAAIAHRMSEVASVGFLFAMKDWVDKREFETLINLMLADIPEARRFLFCSLRCRE